MTEETGIAENAAGTGLVQRIEALEARLKVQQIKIEFLERANLQLRQKIERDSVYARLIETIQAILFTIDADLRITHITRNIQTISRHRSSRLIGRSFLSLIHPDDRDGFQQLCQATDHENGQTIEIRLRSRGGHFRWVWANLVPMVNLRDTEGYKGLLIDIHQRKLTEINLSQSEARHRKIIENIHEGYFECDLQGRITFLNRALLDITGHVREQLLNRSFQTVCPPRTARALRVVFGRIYRTGRDAQTAQYEIHHRDGHTLTVEFAASLIVDPQGEAKGFRGVVRDISDRVKATADEKRRQSQLQQIQKMEALGTLAGGLAHGFNNVLMAIQGNLSIMRMNLKPTDPLHKHLGRILQSTEKGGRLAREILSFAKIGKYVVMPTNLNNVLKSTSRMFARSNPNLQMHEIYERRLYSTRVDRVQIGQVLLSLYMHAAEAMPDGGDLYIHSENVVLDPGYTQPHGNDTGPYVKISVTDSGVGLNEDARSRIFEPFFTPYQPLRFEGLGLAAAYGIIRSHKGIINVYSEKGHGTTFNIYLPAIADELSAETVTTSTPRGSETILMVDDDETAAAAGRDILEHFGYRVLMASDGTEAVSIYAEHKDEIHLVLLDIILPDLSGDQVFYELVKINPDVAVVVASGFNVNRRISTLLNQGCLDFIQKPFQTQALTTKVRNALNRMCPLPESARKPV